MTALTSPDGTPASRYAFGTMQFGGKADRAASTGMFEAAIEAGITHFDTAHLYTEGQSEQILGSLAAPQRARLVIATKIGYRPGADAGQLRAELDLSLSRLRMDCVDILYLHRHDPEIPLEERLAVLAGLKEDGKIRYIGLSNFAAWQVMKADRLLRGMGHRVDIIQPMYSLVKRQAEVELLPMCESEGITCATYSPLGGGLLSGKYLAGAASGRLAEDPRYAARYAPAFMQDTARALAGIASELGLHPATLACAWIAAHPARPVPILSASAPEQLAPSLAALRFDMDKELYERLSGLSPAPPPATDRNEEQ